jgi:hypothetical protein
MLLVLFNTCDAQARPGHLARATAQHVCPKQCKPRDSDRDDQTLVMTVGQYLKHKHRMTACVSQSAYGLQLQGSQPSKIHTRLHCKAEAV